MLGGAISHLMEFDALVHLLVEAFAGCAVGRVEGRIVAVCTSSTSDLSVSVRASEPCVEHNLLQTLAVFPLEVSHEGVVSLTVRETVFFKLLKEYKFNHGETKMTIDFTDDSR